MSVVMVKFEEKWVLWNKEHIEMVKIELRFILFEISFYVCLWEAGLWVQVPQRPEVSEFHADIATGNCEVPFMADRS